MNATSSGDRRALLQQRQRAFAVRRFAHVVAVRAQHGAIHLARVVVVVHQQHAARFERARAASPLPFGAVPLASSATFGRGDRRHAHGERGAAPIAFARGVRRCRHAARPAAAPA